MDRIIECYCLGKSQILRRNKVSATNFIGEWPCYFLGDLLLTLRQALFMRFNNRLLKLWCAHGH